VAEILVRTRAEGEKMLGLLRKGNDFGTLARTYSIRLWAGKNGGELGFGTKGSFGVMGEKFFNAKPGELIGPQFVDPYYGVFKLLERREGRPKTYEEAKDEIDRAHEMQKKQEAFTRGVDALRSRADIHINMEALANIRIDNKARERAL
jgi:parvulin-like peptidyl-prolyl isomerase